GREFLAVPANVARRSGTAQLNHMAGQLLAHHVPLDLEPFYRRRPTNFVAWENDAAEENHLPASSAEVASDRGAIMAEYLSVMDQFLATQADVLSQYFHGHRDGTGVSHPMDAETAFAAPGKPESVDEADEFNDEPLESCAPGPLVGEIISLDP